MILMKANIVWTFILFFFACNSATNNVPSHRPMDSGEVILSFKGEVDIDSPLLLRFEQNVNGVKKFNHLLVGREYLDSLNYYEDSMFSSLLSGPAALMFEPARFLCILNNYKSLYGYAPDIGYENLYSYISDSERDTIWKYKDDYLPNIKRIGPWAYEEIIDKKFLHFAVKGELISLCTSRDMINPFDSFSNNLVDIFVPMSWNR